MPSFLWVTNVFFNMNHSTDRIVTTTTSCRVLAGTRNGSTGTPFFNEQLKILNTLSDKCDSMVVHTQFLADWLKKKILFSIVRKQ